MASASPLAAPDLEAALDAANPTQGGQWDLRNADITDISNTGLITGDAIYLGPGPDSGRGVAFLLDASSLLPEPASLTSLITAALLLRRKKRAAKSLGLVASSLPDK